MQKVYVQNKDGEPLMPCTPAKAKHLLRDKKAEVIHLTPFTIRLNWDCENNTQEIIVGLDTGAVNIGCSAVNGERLLYASETKLRTDIHKKMQRRANYRHTRRCRKLRHRQPRFDNRKSGRQLPPSLQSKMDSTVKIVMQLSKILPISKVRVEIAKFDTQKLQNPDIEGKEYQKGVTEGYDNIRSYVFERDKYSCQICKKSKGILQTHHIKQRKDGGSDRPDNMTTVHKDCHKKFHLGEIEHKFRKPKEYKVETQVTILKDFIVMELKKNFDVELTFGHITKRNRMRLNLPKSHCFDAVAICNPKKIERIDKIFKRVCVTQRRYQMTKGVRSEKRLPNGELFGFRQWDKVKINNQIGFIKGKRSSGFFDVCDIDGNNVSHSVKYTKLQRLYSNNVMEVIASPPTTKVMGIRSETVL
tara:strand:+ start:854 stop:2101 length:1248 start_codon:yes stop_codon:yes gene_type:complete